MGVRISLLKALWQSPLSMIARWNNPAAIGEAMSKQTPTAPADWPMTVTWPRLPRQSGAQRARPFEVVGSARILKAFGCV